MSCSNPTLVSVYTKENAPANTHKLLKHIAALDSNELRILWVFAVIYIPVNQTKVKDVLSSLPWSMEFGGNLAPLMAKQLREKLVSKGLLESLSDGLICSRLIIEIVARQVQAEGEYESVVDAAKLHIPYKSSNAYGYSRAGIDHEIRKIRDALYCADTALLRSALSPRYAYANRGRSDYCEDLFKLCMTPFDTQWFATLTEEMQGLILEYRVQSECFPAHAPDYDYLQAQWQSDRLRHPKLRGILLEWRLNNLQLANVEQLLSGQDDWHSQLMSAWLLALKGAYEDAIPLFIQAQKLARKDSGNKKLCFTSLPGLYFCLALLQSSEFKSRKELDKQLKAISRVYERSLLIPCFEIIQVVMMVLENRDSRSQQAFLKLDHIYKVPEVDLLFVLAKHWLGVKLSDSLLKNLAEYSVIEHQVGNTWYVQQSLGLLRHYNYTNKKISGYQALFDNESTLPDLILLVTLIQPQEPWQRALKALQELSPDLTVQKEHEEKETRIIWLMSGDLEYLEFQPKEQKKTKAGAWTKGRNIALKTLQEGLEKNTSLSEHDIKMCRCIEKDYDYYGPDYSLSNARALQAAVGHPHLYWEHKPEQEVELLAGEIELIVQQSKNNLSIKLHPEIDPEGFEYQRDWLLQQDGTHRIRLYKFNQQHQQIANILGRSGLTVPIAAKQEVLQSISAIAPLLPIQSDIGGGNLEAKEVTVDAQLYMQIQPQQAGFIFSLYVQPLGPNGPMFRPGEGRAIVMAEVDGERLHTYRDLKVETSRYETLLRKIAVLEEDDWNEQEYEWHFSGEEALDVLYQCQAYGEPLILLWPKGGQLKFNKESGLRNMQASVRQSGDWFTLEGGLTLDDGQVITMAKLMSLLDGAGGRFVKLTEDTFLTLTKQLQQRLQALKRHGEQKFHPLAATALEEITDGMVLKGDKHWKKQTDTIQEAYALQPAIPNTLQAELRDYQYEGFSWLVRLAHWGAGACLADDMGLGKTIQALTLILTRSAQGPTLILAPTSVCMNWLNEAARFAPTLNVIRFGGGDRQTTIESAGAYDLVVCSYGLLQTESKRLQSVKWTTIVADEAQALKNPQTKRTQAAMSLKGDFKVATTGTPIENHLGELWTLFRFINPGLLGSLDSFNQRFAGPIENSQDKVARQHLKRLVQPFILRRLKADVLTELPPRTEITISVQQSTEEAVFYEALRRKALESLAENKNDQPGQKQLKIFAEIMKLRRACCNPRLVDSKSQIQSSKLLAFAEIVDELRENNHRALVFSQFVGHLELIREYLDKHKIVYQYLDGSTSVKKREAAVNAFQAGKGELFLISLKAGGSGLNLTAADYVIHMDPWWNPAVEDQASDRAHRLGQKRPVTIYRLVSENTIEQKIIALHSQKRDLADSLLEGSDVSGKLSADEIMELLQC